MTNSSPQFMVTIDAKNYDTLWFHLPWLQDEDDIVIAQNLLHTERTWQAYAATAKWFSYFPRFEKPDPDEIAFKFNQAWLLGKREMELQDWEKAYELIPPEWSAGYELD